MQDLAPRALSQARERFISVSRYGLRARLVVMLTESGGDPKAWGRALDCLAAWRHQEHRKRLLDLIEDYLPFSPDSDAANLIELDWCGRDKARAEFIDGIERTCFLAERYGVSVDFDAEDALKRLRADGLVSADEDGSLSAIAPDDARAHLDRLWERLLDVDSLDRQAPSTGA